MNIPLSEFSESNTAPSNIQQMFVALGDNGEIALTLAGFRHYKALCANLAVPVNLARVKTFSDLTALNCKLARVETKNCLAEFSILLESDEHADVVQSVLDSILAIPKAKKAVVYQFPGENKKSLSGC
ncbi:hypothetical protein LC612_31670 [Nostoc sp. CHAB 5834]|nr:hypothetical protein [Nostoc sp. CHAB 5834]